MSQLSFMFLSHTYCKAVHFYMLGSSTNRLTWGHLVACRDSPIRSGAMQAIKSLFTFYFPNPQPCTIFLYLLSLLSHLPPLFPGYFLFILFINVCYIAASYISYKLLLIFLISTVPLSSVFHLLPNYIRKLFFFWYNLKKIFPILTEIMNAWK